MSIIREKCSDIVLCKKVNGAMKTSSVEFISRSPTPSPMKSKQRRFVLLRRIFEPWKWKRRKKRDRFEQTSRTLERKISMRSTKELIKKRRSHACETQCFPIEPSGCRRDSPLVSMKKKKKGGRTAADSVQSGWPVMASKKSSRSHHLATQSSRAGAAK
ncbi:phosphatase and actin regulator 2 [Trichonephila clavipes]|nr:phosphatase and actin regulator 2 [Trichonephila clavipes]